MGIDTVFFDLGGVILRTEHQAPREHLAERLNVSYEDLVTAVFESETARQASLGHMTTRQHWEAIAARLGRPSTEAAALQDEFFGGDVLDRPLLDFIRSLRPLRRTGLISNAWPDMRDYISRHRFHDAFEALVISAEVGLLKPDPRIYELALRQTGTAPASAVMVDDLPVNVEAAQALGMHGVVFSNTSQTIRDLKAILT